MASNGNSDQAAAEVVQVEEEAEPEYQRSDKYDLFLGGGFSDKIAQELDKTYQQKMTGDEEFDTRALEAIKGLDEETALQVLKHFCDSDLSFVQNKSAFICGAIKMFRTKGKAAVIKPVEAQDLHVPDEEKIKELLERTGYTLNITRNQRQYGGPPPDWEEGAPAPAGTEVFVKNIPKDWFEDKIVPLFEECGKIYDIRLILNAETGFNKGFCFVCFTEKAAAKEAIKKLNGYKASDRFSLNVSTSYQMNRIFIGSIPKTKSKDEIREEFGKITEGLKDVIVYTSSEEKGLNRGFAFLEYNDHKGAFNARKILKNRSTSVFGGVNISVDWADPIIEPDEETMAKVKVVYINNLSTAATEEKIKEKFKDYGEIEKVKKIKDYCFVHYKERESAEKAIEEMADKEFEGNVLSVCLAKPQDNKKKKERQARMQSSGGYFDNQGGFGRNRGGMQRGRGGMGGGAFPQRFPDYGYDDYYYGDYGGGYGDYGGDWSYGGYGYGGPRGRGGMRGGRGARGGPMGGPMRGGRGGGPGMRGSPRGGPRGGRGGRGAMGPRGGKRKMEGGGPADFKRRNTQGWGAAPIAQKPLGYGGDQSWAADSW